MASKHDNTSTDFGLWGLAVVITITSLLLAFILVAGFSGQA